LVLASPGNFVRRSLDMRCDFGYTLGMETITIPILLLMSLATALATAGGVWFVTQKRVRDLEVRTDRHDQKFDQIIGAIGDLRTDMHGLRADVTAGLNGLRADMTAEINGLRADMTAGLNGLRADMTAGLNGLRSDMTAEINGLRSDMDTKIDGLRTEINEIKVEVARVQGSNMALNEKFDLFLQGRLIPAATQPPNVVAA